MARALRLWLLVGAWGLTGLALCLIVLSLPPCYMSWGILVGWPGFIGWGLECLLGANWRFGFLNSEWTVVAGWLVSLALTACCSVTRRCAVFIVAYSVLCLLFVVSIVGWYVIRHLSY